MLKNKIKILAALSVFFATLLTVIFLWRGIEAKAEESLKERLTSISEKLGIPFSFDYLELGLGVATLHGVTLGDQGIVQIESVKIEAAINLFDAQILNPEVVHLIRPSLEATLNEANLIKSDPNVIKLFDRLLASKKNQSIRTNGEFRWPLPNRLRITNGSVVLRDANSNEIAHAAGIDVDLIVPSRQATFGATSLRYHNDIEKNIEGSVKLDNASDAIEFSLSREKSNDSLGWSLIGKIARSLYSANITVDADSLPSFLHARVSKFLSSPEQTGLKGTIEISKAGDSTWQFSSDLRFRDLYILHESLTKEPVGPIAFSLATEMTYSHKTRHVLISNGRIGLPESGSGDDDMVHVAFSASGRLPSKSSLAPTWQAKVRIPPTYCQSALKTLPFQFAPHLKDFKLEGKFGANFDLKFSPDTAESFSYQTFTPTFTCKVISAPDNYSKVHLDAPFTLERAGSRGIGIVEISLTPASPRYAPLSQIGKKTIQAIVAAEDAGFYAHSGVEWAAMEQALRRNLTEKRIALGGSTITMQTVKNLFLTGERTLGRKFQELFLSWHLDQELSKERILEIYMNIVEFGPNLFGITTAAKHFFNKAPAELSLKEAIYLASVMPAPVTRYRYFCLGRTSPNYDDLINTLLRRMHSLNRISYDEYVAALNEPLIFNQVSRLATPECNGVRQIARETSQHDSLGE